MEDVIAVIMGGGRGTRLYPLTAFRSKPAVPFGGKYRLVDISLSNCINSNLRRVFVLTQFNSASLNRHVNRTYRFDLLSRGFVEILAAQQTMDSSDWYQGTADAVRHNLRAINSLPHAEVLILSGDHLYRMDYRDFLDHHRRSGADITLAVIPVSAEAAPSLGIVRVDREGRVVQFAEKPSGPAQLETLRSRAPLNGQPHFPPPGRECLASMGIYIFSPHVLNECLADKSHKDFGKEIIPRAVTRHRVMSYFFDDYWRDIGTIRSFYEANLEMVTAVPPFNFYDERHPIYTHARFLPASKVNACNVEYALLADGCIINRSEIRFSVIGLRSVIGENSRILFSVLMGADYYEHAGTQPATKDAPPLGIGRNCHIERAIIDKNARIGDGVKIINRDRHTEFEGPNYSVRDGIVIIPKNAVIASGTVI